MNAQASMNVEFLRARLLSERIVSRTARQRSEMLSQRVIELEEQLRIVNIQRKKAEKAAEEVLSILETQGITCIHGLSDSSTDQEDNQQTDKEGNPCITSKDIKEDKFLTPSRLNRSSHLELNRLSWRSHDNSLDSLEKQKTKQSRHGHNSSFIITVKSSERHPGRSCCKIKKHYTGSASENELEKSPLPDDGDGDVSHSDDFAENECLVEVSESKMDKFSVDSLAVCPDNRNKESKDIYGKDDGMERALKQQARLIFQFEPMENVQREWEEKFNETKKSMLENPEHRNQVNKAESSIRSPENSNLVGWPQQVEEEKFGVKDISLTEEKKTEKCINCEMASKRATGETITLNVIETIPKAFSIPPQERPDSTKNVHHGPIFEKPSDAPVGNIDVGPRDSPLCWSSKNYYITDNQNKLLEVEHQYDTVSVNENKQCIQPFTVSSLENPGSIYEKSSNIIPINSMMNPPKQRILHTSLTEQRIPVTKEKISTREMLKERRLHQNSRNSLGSVLQALQHARASITHELVKESSSGEGTLAIPSPANPPMKPTPTRKPLDFPIDSSALFRLPSNSFSQVWLSGSNVYVSGLRLAATGPDLGFMASTVSSVKDYFNQSSSQPGFNALHPFNPYMDDMSKVEVRKKHANY